ncbi:hypothetical protein BH11MYX4_BH11MYX4_50690 [soil metagenome]
MDPAKARQKLASTDRAERAAAAEVLKSAYAKEPASLGDHGESYWAERLKRGE